MTSEAFVWIWLPGAVEPVICGKLTEKDKTLGFIYGQSYLSRKEAIPLDPRELPLREEVFQPRVGETHNVIRDSSPDAWGRRVLLYRFGQSIYSELGFIQNSGSDRIGGIDIQSSSEFYHPQARGSAILDHLVSAAELIEQGKTLPAELDHALLHGSSVGGARPKALLEDIDNKWIAKFSSSTDQYPIVRAEFAAMWLANKCKIEVPEVHLVKSLGKDIILVRRFDRVKARSKWLRRLMISGLTALQLHETEATLASYLDLAGFIRRFGRQPKEEMAQLYRRMVFNILTGNNDDHARNHAFFWEGSRYELTPAYDLCPMLRSGHTANQAMIVGEEGRLSTLKNALSEPGLFGLSKNQATLINNELVDTISTKWAMAADRAGLTKIQSDLLRQSTVLSPGCFY